VTFGHPYLLLTLLVIPAALLAYRWNERRRARYAVRYTNVAVLEQVIVRVRPWRRWLVNTAFLLALAALCVAVARPHTRTTTIADNATIVLVLDVSGSMHAVDVKPTRLAAAQKALHLFIDKVPKRVKLSLILFAGDAQVATPPTTDHQLVGNAVDDAGFFGGFGGTAIGDALALAVQVGVRSAGLQPSGPSALQGSRQLASYVAAPPTKSSLVSILFLSDGHQNRGLIQPLEGAQRAKQAGVPVYTVALGTTGNTHLADGYGFFGGGGGFGGGAALAPDPKTLSAIAHVTGGEFFRARTAGALQDAYKTLGSKLGKAHGRHEVTDLFTALGAGLLVLAGVLSALWAPKLP
jgi:Ca-activated chloride channel family protein